MTIFELQIKDKKDILLEYIMIKNKSYYPSLHTTIKIKVKNYWGEKI